MSAEQVTTLIGNVGFPIAAFLLLFWFINKTMKENTAAVIALKDVIKELCVAVAARRDASHQISPGTAAN